jgi:hypothetical protein
MESKRGTLTVLVVTVVVILGTLPCTIAQDNPDREPPPDKPRMQRPDGERPGFRSGERGDRGRRGGWPGRPDGRRRRPEFSDEQIDSVLAELKKRDPNSAKELTDLRKKDPNEFRNQLRMTAGPEIGRIIMSSWAERRQTEFLEWLEKYVPKEAEELAQLKETETELYTKKYELIWQKYGRIFGRTRRNPELAKVLIADLELRERQRELQNKYRTADAEEDKKELEARLEVVVSDRYDLIVRQKQMEYEQLLKRLEELQKEVKASLKEIETWLDKGFKEKTVQEHMEDLTADEIKRGPFD